MSSYEYRVWSIKAKSDLVIAYECEKCGASNIPVKTIVGFGSRNDDHQAKWSKSYTNEITNKIVTDMAKRPKIKLKLTSTNINPDLRKAYIIAWKENNAKNAVHTRVLCFTRRLR